LSQATAGALEYRYLSIVQQAPTYEWRHRRIRAAILKSSSSSSGLYPYKWNLHTGKPVNDIATLGAEGSYWLQALLKEYIQSARIDRQIFEVYERAMVEVEQSQLISNDGQVYDLNVTTRQREAEPRKSWDVCYLGTILALDRNLTTNWALHLRWAESITERCHHRLSKESSPQEFAQLSPVMAESYFILWRLTKREQYRTYAWQLTVRIFTTTRACHSGGYSLAGPVVDVQPAHFLGRTLKFLYLIFDEDSRLPLDGWVLNAVGQPLPICGTHPTWEHCTEFYDLKYFNLKA